MFHFHTLPKRQKTRDKIDNNGDLMDSDMAFAVTTVTTLLSLRKELQVFGPRDHRFFTPNIAAGTPFATACFLLKKSGLLFKCRFILIWISRI